jgi:hypothetical protein
MIDLNRTWSSRILSYRTKVIWTEEQCWKTRNGTPSPTHSILTHTRPRPRLAPKYPSEIAVVVGPIRDRPAATH